MKFFARTVIYLTIFHSQWAQSTPFEISGPSEALEIIDLFFSEYNKSIPNEPVEITNSKNNGSQLNAIYSSKKNTFGRISEPLDEKFSRSKGQILLAQRKIVFYVNSKSKVKALTIDQIEKIFSRKITYWSELGGEARRIHIFIPDQESALYKFIENRIPSIKSNKYLKKLDPEQKIQDFLDSKDGRDVLTFGFLNREIRDNTIFVSGFSEGVGLGLVYDKKISNPYLIDKLIEFSESTTWKKILVNSDYLPQPLGY